MLLLEIELDEHVIRCSMCRRDLIVKDNVNNGVAFLSHLKIDHGIFYTAQRMTQTRLKKQHNTGQMLDSTQ